MPSISLKEIDTLLLSELESSLECANAASQSAAVQATHSESIAENKYDTLGLELSYLAHGQAMREQQLLKDCNWLKQRLNQFHYTSIATSSDTVTLGTLVKLSSVRMEPRHLFYYLLPVGAGISLLHNDISISIISADSPRGRVLLNKELDEQISINVSTTSESFFISSIFQG